MQKRAGVPQIRFHDLRHSFATLSLEQGMDIKTISHMLGHTDAGFTMNTYMHGDRHNATNGGRCNGQSNSRNRKQAKEQAHTFLGIAKGSRSKILEPN